MFSSLINLFKFDKHTKKRHTINKKINKNNNNTTKKNNKNINQNKNIKKQNTKKQNTNIKEYLIHWNGDLPLKVIIDYNTMEVNIYSPIEKYPDYNKGNVKYPKLVYSVKPQKIFIGKSKSPYDYFKNNKINNNKNSDPKLDGNTILLKINHNEYLYIGSIIYKFKTKDEIIEYKSPLAGNDVPMAYAIDKNNRYYLMLEQIIIDPTIKKIENKHVLHHIRNDPYDYYYNNNKIILKEVGYDGFKPIYDKNENKFKFIWNPKYKSNYNSKYKNKLYLISQNKKLKVTKEIYNKIMHDWSEKKLIFPLNIELS